MNDMLSEPASPAPHRSHRVVPWVLLLVLLLGAGVGAYLWRAAPSGTAAVAPPPPVPVQIATVSRADVPVLLTGIGRVRAFNTVTVSSRVEGELQQVLFTEGQMVKAGDLLAIIDPRPFQAALDQAEARLQQDQAALANARLVLSRDTQLAVNEFTSQQVLDNQRSAVQQLEAQVAQDQAAITNAATQLSYTRITAPLAGRTGIRLVDQGNMIHPADQKGLVVITQTEPISVLSTLPEQDLPAVRAAQRAGPVQLTALTEDGAQTLATGTLALIDNEIDAGSGTIRLKSTFPNQDEALWPGQFVQVQLRQEVLHQALTVPSGAVQRGADGYFVYTVAADNRVAAQPVALGQIAGGVAVVRSGLAAGDRVVTAGQYRLAPGTLVAANAGAGG